MVRATYHKLWCREYHWIFMNIQWDVYQNLRHFEVISRGLWVLFSLFRSKSALRPSAASNFTFKKPPLLVLVFKKFKLSRVANPFVRLYMYLVHRVQVIQRVTVTRVCPIDWNGLVMLTPIGERLSIWLNRLTVVSSAINTDNWVGRPAINVHIAPERQ